MRPAALLPLTAAALLTAAPALAQSPKAPSIRLDYTRAPSVQTCPDEAAFRLIVAAFTEGADPFTDKGALRLSIDLDHQGQDFTAAISFHDTNGRKRETYTLDSADSCRALVQLVAASVAVRYLSAKPTPRPTAHPRATFKPPFDFPDAGDEQGPGLAHPAPFSAPSSPALSPTAAAVTTAPDAIEPEARAAKGPRIQVALGLLAPIGTAPGPTAGVSASIGIRGQIASIHFEGRAELPRSTDAQSIAVDAKSATFAGSLVPCLHYRWLFGCGLATIGLARTTTDAGVIVDGDKRTRVELGGRVGVEIKLPGPFSAQITSDLVYVPTAHTVFVDDAPAFTQSSIAWLPGARFLASF